MNAVLNPTLMSHLSSKSEGEHCTTFLTSLFHVFSSHQWLFLASLFLLTQEKNFHLVTVLLSLTVFQQSISDAMPVTSLQIPLLGTYFNCIMFMVASSVVTTIMILN